MSETVGISAAPALMAVREVAAYTGMSVKFWDRLREVGGGPRYIKLAPKAVRYRREDVEGWLNDRARTKIAA